MHVSGEQSALVVRLVLLHLHFINSPIGSTNAYFGYGALQAKTGPMLCSNLQV
jgi:hypothetical protein